MRSGRFRIIATCAFVAGTAVLGAGWSVPAFPQEQDLNERIKGKETELQKLRRGIAAVSYTHLTLPTTPYV